MGQRVKLESKRYKIICGAKANFSSFKFFNLDPKPSDLVVSRLKLVNNRWRIELFSVATEWDDLRLGVKG